MKTHHSHTPPLSRRTVLAGGLAGATAAVVGSLAAPVLGSAGALAGPAVSGSGDRRERLVDARVDLKITGGAAVAIVGDVGGEPVDLRGTLYPAPGQPATITGTIAGRQLTSVLTQQDQVPQGAGYRTTTRLTASVGDVAAVLSASFHLDGNYDFEDGVISGTEEGLHVAASVVPAHPGGDIGLAARIRGNFAGAAVDVLGTLPGGGPDNAGSVIGTVDGQPVKVQVQPGGPSSDLPATGPSSDLPATLLRGTFSGPIELLALLAGAVAYFTP